MSATITYVFIECEVTAEESGIPQYIYYDDGVTEWRKGVRGGIYVIDKALDYIGFEGEEDNNWENVYSIS